MSSPPGQTPNGPSDNSPSDNSPSGNSPSGNSPSDNKSSDGGHPPNDHAPDGQRPFRSLGVVTFALMLGGLLIIGLALILPGGDGSNQAGVLPPGTLIGDGPVRLEVYGERRRSSDACILSPPGAMAPFVGYRNAATLTDETLIHEALIHEECAAQPGVLRGGDLRVRHFHVLGAAPWTFTLRFKDDGRGKVITPGGNVLDAIPTDYSALCHDGSIRTLSLAEQRTDSEAFFETGRIRVLGRSIEASRQRVDGPSQSPLLHAGANPHSGTLVVLRVDGEGFIVPCIGERTGFQITDLPERANHQSWWSDGYILNIALFDAPLPPGGEPGPSTLADWIRIDVRTGEEAGERRKLIVRGTIVPGMIVDGGEDRRFHVTPDRVVFEDDPDTPLITGGDGAGPISACVSLPLAGGLACAIGGSRLVLWSPASGTDIFDADRLFGPAAQAPTVENDPFRILAGAGHGLLVTNGESVTFLKVAFDGTEAR